MLLRNILSKIVGGVTVFFGFQKIVILTRRKYENLRILGDLATMEVY